MNLRNKDSHQTTNSRGSSFSKKDLYDFFRQSKSWYSQILETINTNVKVQTPFIHLLQLKKEADDLNEKIKSQRMNTKVAFKSNFLEFFHKDLGLDHQDSTISNFDNFMSQGNSSKEPSISKNFRE